MQSPADQATIDRIKREAREAAARYADINAACPYPFASEEGRVFREEFNANRATLGVATELEQ
jgi:hypothetical protein